MIYLDYSATTPVSDTALEVYQTVAKQTIGNSMSLHDPGTEADRLVTICRDRLTSMIKGKDGGLFFTSGGTESNTLALIGLARAHRHKGNHIVASPSEHASVINTLTLLEKEGFEVTYLPLDEEGKITHHALENALTDHTIIAAISHVNSEIGTIQDIRGIGDFCFENNILFHCDAVQSFGKLDINVQENHVTSLTVSSHKIYGPKGVGACYVDPTVPYEPVYPGGTHEFGFRQGTVNVPGIASFTAAAEESAGHCHEEYERMNQLKERLMQKLEASENPFFFECKDTAIPYILGVRVKGIEGQYVMLECNRHGIAVATGSACKAGQQTPSKTLLAMGRSENEARELVRLSFGRQTTADDIDQTADVLNELVNKCINMGRTPFVK